MKRKSDLMTKEQLEKDFFELGLSINQVRKRYGCSYETVQRKLKKYNLKLNSTIWYQGGRVSQCVRKLLLRGTKFTPRQQSIIVGSVLGDGCLNKCRTCINAALFFSQCAKRKTFVEWLCRELFPFTTRGVRLDKHKVGTESAAFTTIYHPGFTKFYNMFYPEGKKIVPSNIGDYLDELALAVWYMGDGHTDKSWSSISTQGFTEQDCKLLLDVLREKFKVVGHIEWGKQSSGKQLPGLRFNSGTGANHRLHEVVDSLLHKDFEYKKFKVGPGVARGERSGAAKLTEKDVKEIRHLAAKGMAQTVIAKKFRVGSSNVSMIVNYKAWKHVK